MFLVRSVFFELATYVRARSYRATRTNFFTVGAARSQGHFKKTALLWRGEKTAVDRSFFVPFCCETIGLFQKSNYV